ncbi:MAG TPA: vitamin K epoxide reductase family protein [Solirubrobacterales bacterium]|nr:vitamin K epoxide reductase family protein [Solirubrobacterales bacterium]
MSYPSEGNLQRAIAFAAALGVGVATYIAVEAAGGDAPTCLAGSSGCATVAKSSYSHVAGINIAVFGIVGYALLLASAFFASDLARFGGFLVALGGFGYSVFLTYIEIFKIEAICQWCVGSAILMTILLLLNATRLIGYAGGAEALPDRA